MAGPGRLPTHGPHADGTRDRRTAWQHKLAARTRSDTGEGLASILALSGAQDIISFAGGFPDPSTFPGQVLTELLSEILSSDGATALQYSPVEGLPGPRDYIAGRLGSLEGRRPPDDELIVTSGAVEALELLGKALLDRGDRVLVEAPTYLGAIMAFKSFQANVTPVPMDDEGLEVDHLASLIERSDTPKLLYTIPDYQNPTGIRMELERRLALVELARRVGLLIVEDVAYRELGFGRDRLPSLWSLAPDTVVQAGTFSKTFFPGVRLGWAAGPPLLIRWMRWAKQNTDQCAAALGQRLLEAYGRRGLMETHNTAARRLYGQRCRATLAALDAEMPSGVTWTRPEGGFFTWLTLPEGSDSRDIAVQAHEEGLAFVPGRPFFCDARGKANIRLSFSCVQEPQIADGVARLGRLLRRDASRGGRDDRVEERVQDVDQGHGSPAGRA